MAGSIHPVNVQGTTGTVKVNGWVHEGDGTFSMPVKGESSYQRALWKIVGTDRRGQDRLRHEVNAIILPEPENRYDPNAMRVFIESHLVGYLGRDDAKDLVEEMVNTKGEPRVVICKGIINGGFKAKDGTIAHLGVMLDLDFPLDN